MMTMKWPGDITDLYIAWQCLGEQIKQFMKSKAKLTGVEAVSLQDRYKKKRKRKCKLSRCVLSVSGKGLLFRGCLD